MRSAPSPPPSTGSAGACRRRCSSWNDTRRVESRRGGRRVDIDQLMRAVAIVLAVTAIAVSIARRLNLGSTLGLLVVGAALGPYSPHPLLGMEHVDELQAIGEIGIVLLLFLLGLDIRPSRLWAMRGMVVGLGTAQYVLSAAAVAGALLLQGYGGGQRVVVIGLALAMSSAAVALGALEEHGDIGRLEGRATIAVQILQSFVLIGLLTVIPLLGTPVKSIQPPGLRHTLEVLGVILAIQVTARWILPRLLTLTATSLGSGAFALTIIAAVFGAAATLDSLGVSLTPRRVRPRGQPLELDLRRPGEGGGGPCQAVSPRPLLHHHRHGAGLARGAGRRSGPHAGPARAAGREVRGRGRARARLSLRAPRGPPHRGAPDALRRGGVRHRRQRSLVRHPGCPPLRVEPHLHLGV